MKLIAPLFLASLVIGCSPMTKKSGTPTPDRSLAQYDKYFLSSKLAYSPATASAEALEQRANEHNDLSVSLYKELDKDSGGKNVIYSPLSIQAAFALLYPGVGNTEPLAADMRSVLKFGATAEDFSPIMGAYLRSMNESFELGQGYSDKTSKWAMNNALFIEDSLKEDVQARYLDHIKTNFDARLGILDFKGQPEESRVIINRFTETATNGLVKELLPKDSIRRDTVAVLLNTIYMLADWANPFKKEATQKREFNVTSSKKVSVDMMQDERRIPIYQGAKSSAVSLDYVSKDIAMLVILPKSGVELSEVEGSLNAATLATIITGLEDKMVSIQLPKFKYEFEKKLTDPLKALGMSNLLSSFSSEPIFGGATNPLAISDIFHKAKIIVDEKGTEAAAATAIVAVETSAQIDPPTPIPFVVNKPALFMIYEKVNNTIIFMGKLADPSKE